MTVVEARPHEHDWEKGRHMADAFYVDGRILHCAICGVPKGEAVDQRKRYRVSLRGLYDDEERLTEYVYAFGPHDVRGQMREAHPDFAAVRIEEVGEWPGC